MTTGFRVWRNPGSMVSRCRVYQGVPHLVQTTTDQFGHYLFSSQDTVPGTFEVRIDATVMAPGT